MHTHTCIHTHAHTQVGSQREVGRALANLAASDVNHALLISEGGFSLCMDLVVSNSAGPYTHTHTHTHTHMHTHTHTHTCIHMDLVVSNSAEVQQQATRALGNLALAADESVTAHMVDEGVLELLVLLAASWYACMHVCVYVCVCMCMYDEGVLELLVLLAASWYACMHVCVYVCVCMCMYDEGVLELLVLFAASW